MSGGDTKAVRKAAKGGAAGAASAEIMAEMLMPAALKRIDSQLQGQGLSPDSQAYHTQWQTLLKEELRVLKLYGEMAAVITAQSIGGDLEAAQLAARNALTYNFSQMMVGIKRWEKNEMTPEEQEEAKKQFKEMLKRLLKDPSDQPDRIQDTEYESLRQSMLETVRGWYEGRERLFKGELNDATIGRTIAALGLDGVTTTCEALNLLSGGLLGQAGKGINTGLNVLANTLGGAVEETTGDKRWGQNVADWGKVLGEVAPLVQGAKAAHRARQLQALDLADTVQKGSLVAKPHIRSTTNRISAEKWINQTVSQKEYSDMLMANSVFNQIQLRNQLIAEQISKGHAFEKHILHQGEFPGWIRTHKQLQSHIENVLNSNNTKKLYIGKERTVYCNKDSHTVIIHNPHAADGGTVFQPTTSIEKFLEMRGWK